MPDDLHPLIPSRFCAYRWEAPAWRPANCLKMLSDVLKILRARSLVRSCSWCRQGLSDKLYLTVQACWLGLHYCVLTVHAVIRSLPLVERHMLGTSLHR